MFIDYLVSVLVELIFIVIVHAHFVLSHLSDDVIGCFSVTLHELLHYCIIIQVAVDRVPDHLLYLALHVLYIGHGAVLASNELWALLTAPSSRSIIISIIISPIHDDRLSGISLPLLSRCIQALRTHISLFFITRILPMLITDIFMTTGSMHCLATIMARKQRVEIFLLDFAYVALETVMLRLLLYLDRFSE